MDPQELRRLSASKKCGVFSIHHAVLMRSRAFAVQFILLLTFTTVHALEQEGALVPSHLAASESRTLDDVNRVTDEHKVGFYSIYTRALRDKPTLQGTIVLSFSIAPNGKVTRCNVASSTLNDSDFENRIVERFRSIDFGVKGTRTYSNSDFPMTFLSASGTPSKRLRPIAHEHAGSG